MTRPGTSHLTLAQLAASGSTEPLPAAAVAHLSDCGYCQVRSRAVVADGVGFLLSRCQPPPGLMEGVFEATDAQPAHAQPLSAHHGRLAGDGHLRWPGSGGRYNVKRVALVAAAAVVLLGGAGAGLVTALTPGQAGGAAEGNGSAIAHAGVSLVECQRLQLQVIGGTLQSVSGTDLVLNVASYGTPLTVTTSATTEIFREVTGTPAAITYGAHVLVAGAAAGTVIAAGLVGIMPGTASAVPTAPGGSRAEATPGLAYGLVTDASGTGFTVVESDGTRVPVTISASTTVIRAVRSPLAQFQAGEKTSVVGSMGPGGTMAAVSLEQGTLQAGALKALKELLPYPRGFPNGPAPQGSVHVVPGPPAGSWPTSPPNTSLPSGLAGPGLLPYLLGGISRPFASLGCDPSAITSVELLALALGS